MPELQARIDDVLELAKDSEVEISIALPILRPSRFEWSLEKLTELGVNEIVPLSTERSVPRENKGSRWQSILRESAQQCERAYIPDLLEPMCLGEYLKHSSSGEDSAIFICAERSGDSAILKTRSALHAVLCNSPHKAPHKISVIVGAEGGFTLSELMLAEKLGAKPVSLGKRMLRSETAAVYAAAVVQAVLG
jgi:16S rRNA (uracil1498-N3)-methyltransferase